MTKRKRLRMIGEKGLTMMGRAQIEKRGRAENYRKLKD
jgi:hypothetical protein